MNIEQVGADILAELEASIPEFDRHYTLDEIQLRISGRKALLLAAFVDGRAVAYKAGYEDVPRRFYSWIGGVLPEYRKCGFAKALLARQEEWCAEQGYNQIVVKSENRYRGMLCLLIQNGYDIVGIDLNGQITFRKRL